MKLAHTALALVVGWAVLGTGLRAQDTPAKLWQELETLLPRKTTPTAPIGTPSAAIDWPTVVTKAEELMVRSGGTPVEPYAMFYLGGFYFDSGRFDEAKALFETLRDDSRFSKHPLVTIQLAKDGKTPVTQAIEDCASEMSWRTRHPRPPIPVPVLDTSVTATIQFTTGDVKIQFYKNVAPKHVENFLKHAAAGDYDGTKIGQVMQDAMVNVGDPASKLVADAEGKRPPPPQIPPIAAEFSNLSHTRGMVAMSRNMSTNESHGMQFVFVLKDNSFFDFTQTIFGRVIEGMEVVDAISKQQKTPGSASEVSIQGIKVEQK
jgi:peptidyl-prolyl cis-trans isomerase B (cyclophilin B)